MSNILFSYLRERDFKNFHTHISNNDPNEICNNESLFKYCHRKGYQTELKRIYTHHKYNHQYPNHGNDIYI